MGGETQQSGLGDLSVPGDSFLGTLSPSPEDANSGGVSFPKNLPLEIVPPWRLQPLLGGQHHLGACGETVPSGRGGESGIEMGGKTVG